MEEQLNLHLKEYEVTFRAVAVEMQKVWQDLEVSESARQVALGEAMAQACHAWSSALSRCTQHRTEVADRISALLDQTGMIADELGEAASLGSRVRHALHLSPQSCGPDDTNRSSQAVHVLHCRTRWWAAP